MKIRFRSIRNIISHTYVFYKYIYTDIILVGISFPFWYEVMS